MRFRVSESSGISQFLAIGEACADHVGRSAHHLGGDLSQADRVLDFGCGCGRTLRWMVAKHPEVEVHGADVDAEAIGWCSRNLTAAHVRHTNAEPPLPYPDEHFDVVYGVSVFTHLDEHSQDNWIPELRRILKPNGLLVISVNGERAAGALNAENVRTLLRTGFFHTTTRKLSGIVPEWYNTTWHSERYITDRLRFWFSTVRYIAVPEGMQDFVIAKR